MKFVKKIKPFFVDARGEMSHLVDGDVAIHGVLLITSKKGSIRANHFHKKDSHYCYFLAGSMEYTWRDVSKKNAKKHITMVKAGEVFYTPPMIEHAMKFLTDSVFLTFATKPRDRKDYEKDTVRVELI